MYKSCFTFGKLNDLDPRSLSQFQLKFATQNTIVKSARIIGNFHHHQPSLLVWEFCEEEKVQDYKAAVSLAPA